MRIVHVMTHLRLGAGRAIVDLCVEQHRCGHEVLVVLSEDAEGAWSSHAGLIAELRAAGIEAAQGGDLFHREPKRLREASQTLKARVGDWHGVVAHAHTAMTAAVARWAGAPTVVVTCHGWNPARPGEYDVQDALAYALADAILSPSNAWAERVRGLPGAPHVEVVPYGFDLDRYPARIRSAHPAPPRRIVCVGELTDRKGQDVLLDAWPLVSGHVPGASLHLVGTGEAEPRLRRRAAALLGKGEGIHFRGHLDAPYLELRDGDLFCLPTRSDNQPVAIVEALVAGVPVVASAVGGITEMLAGAPGCATVPTEDVHALASALRHGLSTPWGAAEGERLEALARERYAVATCASATADVYERGLTPRPADT